MQTSPSAGPVLPGDITPLARASASGDRHGLFLALDHFLQPVLHQALCTVNRYEQAAGRVVRAYSSDPSSYPVGGSKNKAGTAWGRHVLEERRIFVGEGRQAIRAFFDDHDAIVALGLNSVINVPVVFGHTCLGTLNLLMTKETVEPAQLQWAQLGGLLALPGFMQDRD